MVAATQDAGSAAALIASLNTKSGTTSTDSATSTQDRFLKMLVAQLQNQDPLNPMDNAEITSQMAQLSTVTGIDKLNETLLALSNSMALGQSVTATSMIGHGVLVEGSALNLVNGSAVGGMQLTQAADSVTVTIKDSSGNIVNKLQFGAQDAGVLPFSWNGETSTGATAADGKYTFSVEAVLDGSSSTPAALAYGQVNAVTPGTQGATLEVSDLGSFLLSAVKQVL
jgi:flagellar basal-body rod modification protein FlgD